MESTFEWIKKCIETSTHPFHVQCCKTLIHLFELQHGETETWSYNSKLKDILLLKENEIKNL